MLETIPLMHIRALILGLLLLPFSGIAQARLYQRPIHIITGNYDLVDTTYIDRGRLDGVKVGDKFQVKFRDGKLVTVVVVTGVFERMASVKIVDSWLLKNDQLAGYKQRPMIIALEPFARRRAPHIPDSHGNGSAHAPTGKTATSKELSTSSKSTTPAAPSSTPNTPASGLSNTTPAAPTLSSDTSLPPASAQTAQTATPNASLPSTSAPAVQTAAPDAGLPPANTSAAQTAAPDAGLPSASAPAAQTAATNGNTNIPPPPE